MTHQTIDFTRPPTDKEKEQLQRRLARLQKKDTIDQLARVQSNLLRHRSASRLRENHGLIVRAPFSYLAAPVTDGGSDRKAPKRTDRPPATRISSSRGSALRLELTMIALAQFHRRTGARAHLSELGIPITGDSQTTGWADLVAAAPTDSTGKNYFNPRDKRARTVRSALRTLEEANLVRRRGEHPGASFENFVLLSEGQEEATEYTVPSEPGPDVFILPSGFISNGWIHLLEDSEIAVLLMAACRRGAWDEEGLWAFSGAVRLQNYGIHRDPYARARKTLEWFGLLSVHEVNRHDDGRAENGELHVHRIGLNHEGFESDAFATVTSVIAEQLARSPRS